MSAGIPRRRPSRRSWLRRLIGLASTRNSCTDNDKGHHCASIGSFRGLFRVQWFNRELRTSTTLPRRLRRGAPVLLPDLSHLTPDHPPGHNFSKQALEGRALHRPSKLCEIFEDLWSKWCPACFALLVTAGPSAIRESGPNQRLGLDGSLVRMSSSAPRLKRYALHRRSPPC